MELTQIEAALICNALSFTHSFLEEDGRFTMRAAENRALNKKMRALIAKLQAQSQHSPHP